MGKKYLIIENEARDKSGAFLHQKIDAIVRAGGEYELFGEYTGDYSDITAAIVLGGDGTLIRAAGSLKRYDFPICNINTGTLGFLSCAESNDIKETVERLINGDFKTESRMMLDVSINGRVEETVLNDAVISRNDYSRIIKLMLYVNDEKIGEISGDGIIVSTPTGSTGYNLSAGGPVCTPEAEVILISPICPHSISSRVIVVSPHDTVRIEVIGSSNGDPIDIGVTNDGRVFKQLKPGDTVSIRKSDYKINLVRSDKKNFFELLKSKLF